MGSSNGVEASKRSRYVTSHPDRLNSAIPSCGKEMKMARKKELLFPKFILGFWVSV